MIQKIANSPSFKAVIPIKSLVIDNVTVTAKCDGQESEAVNVPAVNILTKDKFVCHPNKFAYETRHRTNLQKALWAFGSILTKNEDEKPNKSKFTYLFGKVREYFKQITNPNNSYGEYYPPCCAVDNKKEPIYRIAYSKTGRIYLLTGKDAENFADKGKDIGLNKRCVNDAHNMKHLYPEGSYDAERYAHEEEVAKQDVAGAKGVYREAVDEMATSPNRFKNADGEKASLTIHARLLNADKIKPDITEEKMRKLITRNSLVITGFEFTPDEV